MFTRCPSCQTLFRVRAETLRVAHGEVRCGRCGLQFNALDSLAENPETLAAERNGALADASVGQESAAVEDQQASMTDEQDPSASQLQDDDAADDLPEPPQVIEPAPEVQESVPEEVLSEAATSDGMNTGLTPDAIHQALLSDESTATAWGLRLAGLGAVLLLLTALGVQWMYMQRVPLYAQPQWRPVLQHMCALLACELPLPSRPEQIEILERVVREHPRVPKSLLVDMTFVSRGAEPMAYPIIELRLADVSGNRVMGRQFTPAEYLPAGLDRRAGLSPDKPVHITLELVAPDTDVVSFQFDFL